MFDIIYFIIEKKRILMYVIFFVEFFLFSVVGDFILVNFNFLLRELLFFR